MRPWDDLFLQRAIEPLGDAVGLGLGDEGVGRLDAPELDLVGEVVRQILGAVIHPQGQPPSRAGRGRAIQPGKPHGDRLQGGEAVAALADMPADTLGVPMLDGGEDPAPAVVHREHPNAIGAPHEVRGMSDDLTVMGIAATAAAAMGREQIVSYVQNLLQKGFDHVAECCRGHGWRVDIRYRSAGHAQPPSGGLLHQLAFVLRQ